MKSLDSRARWMAALLCAGLLMVAGTGVAEASPHSGTESVTRLPSSQYAIAPLVNADSTKAYVASIDDVGTSLDVVNTRTGKTTAHIATSGGRWAGPLLFGSGGKQIYLLTEGTLNVFDIKTNTLRSSFPVPDQPRPTGSNPGSLSRMAISPDGASVYLSQTGPDNGAQSTGPSRLLVFSTVRQAFTTTVPLPGESPRAVVVRPNGKDLYVSGDVGLIHLDVSTGVPTLLRTLSDTGFVDELALTPDGSRLYALSKPDGHAVLVDLDSDRVLTTIDFQSNYQPVLSPAVSPDGSRFYVLEDDHRSVPKVLSYKTATNTRVARETVTGFAMERGTGLTLGPDGDTMYVTGVNYADDPGAFLQIVEL
ncbi:WD40 repeat domain-containing protein [Streptomyces sp. NPDC056132]|uniref:WD40 repeat domain-containing protein n=1 Tax=Streptomyces sp. NPDC056132 TaxID=3345722 RepID=UPI0035DC6CAD